MAEKSVKVSIDGVETVSKAAKEAEGGLSGFVSSAKGLLTGLAAAAAGLALADFFRTAIAEAQNSREAMGQLAIAVNNSGASFQAMEPAILKALDALSRTTKFSDDDFARAMQQMTLKTGDAGWALKNMGLVADVAAASGKDLSDAADAVAKAHEGNFKALNLMIPGIKDAANWEEILAARTHGAAAAQMEQLGPIEAIEKQFGELAEAVGRAMLGNDDFSKSGFGIATMLANLGGWIDANKGSVDQFFDAIAQTWRFLVDALSPSLGVLGRMLGVVLPPMFKVVVGAIVLASESLTALSVVSEEVVGKVLQYLGWLVQKGGGLLKVFGINVVQEAGVGMQEFGKKLDTEASARWDKLTGDHDAFWGRMKAGGAAAVTTVTEQEQSKTRVTKQALLDQEQAYKDYVAALKAHWKLIDDNIVSYKEILATMQPAVKEAMRIEAIDAQNKALDASRQTANDLWAAIKQQGNLPPLVAATTESVKDLGGKLADGARSALDLAGSFGMVDDKTKNALNSVINLGTSIGKIIGGDMIGGVTGVIGATGSIVNAMMHGDDARKRLLEANNTQLARLTHEVGNLRLNVTGSQLSGVKSAIGSVIGQITNFNPAEMGSTVFNALQKAGLSMSDLDAVAKELGINIHNGAGGLDKDGLKQLLTALGLIEPAQFGSDFTGQLESTKTGFGVFGTDTAGQATQLGSLFGRTSNAFKNVFDINDLAGSKTRLQSLFTRMQNGQISATEMGGMTGTQFLDAITTMLGLITDLQAAPTGSGGGSTGTGTGSGTDSTGTSGSGGAGGAPAGPIPKTLDDVVAGIIAQTDQFTVYHASSLGFQERTANATESTAANTFAALKYLSRIAYGASASNDDMGRMVAVERRLTGDPTL